MFHVLPILDLMIIGSLGLFGAIYAFRDFYLILEKYVYIGWERFELQTQMSWADSIDDNPLSVLSVRFIYTSLFEK